jgi:hypothetical protein
MTNAIQGRLEAFFETGTEGVIWSLEDRILPGYDGLFPLHKGDHLTIFDDAGNELWQGAIKFEYKRNWQEFPMNPGHGQQAVRNHWVHGLQTDVEPDTWANWFFDKRRAILRPKQPHILHSDGPHPFGRTADELLRTSYRYFNLDVPARKSAYHAARYQWITWYGRRIDDDDNPNLISPRWEISEVSGMHAKLGFTEDQALLIAGSPTIEELQAWQLGQHTPIRRAMFFRLAMLAGIVGRLILIFGETDRMRMWLDQQVIADRPMRENFFTLKGLRRVHDMLRQIVDQPPHGFEELALTLYKPV